MDERFLWVCHVEFLRITVPPDLGVIDGLPLTVLAGDADEPLSVGARRAVVGVVAVDEEELRLLIGCDIGIARPPILIRNGLKIAEVSDVDVLRRDVSKRLRGRLRFGLELDRPIWIVVLEVAVVGDVTRVDVVVVVREDTVGIVVGLLDTGVGGRGLR
ncbi:hypothetical protein [Haloferax sp. ATB1]|uniref:hypothetical protein n=1 Tax=Haloferax sp. ATB1 TaxID=1508454 RepID=UPI000B2A0AE2|nr:hypothetical protein [Haloferax sp. ATB1]